MQTGNSGWPDRAHYAWRRFDGSTNSAAQKGRRGSRPVLFRGNPKGRFAADSKTSTVSQGPEIQAAATQLAGAQPGRAPLGSGAETDTADPSGVPHLGFRYALQLVNATSAKAEVVDPDRDFRKGECVRIEVESNHSGYLYILSKQSSGGGALFPNTEMPDESNVADPEARIRAPKDYCFEISDPPGIEAATVDIQNPARFLRPVRCRQSPAAAGEFLPAGFESGSDGPTPAR